MNKTKKFFLATLFIGVSVISLITVVTKLPRQSGLQSQLTIAPTPHDAESAINSGAPVLFSVKDKEPKEPPRTRLAQERAVRSMNALLEGPLFKRGVVIDSYDSAPDQKGVISRVQLVKTDFKYPLLRTIDTVTAATEASPEDTTARVAMIADHLLVTTHTGTSYEEVQAAAQLLGFQVRKVLHGNDAYLIEIPHNSVADFDQALSVLKKSTRIFKSAEPDFIVSTSQLADQPNDPRFADQYALENRGQYQDSTVGADIGLRRAWNSSTGNKQNIVAVIDTGIDYNHEDLAANIYSNPLEVVGDKNGDGAPGVALVDDDNDGLVDEDSRGCSRFGKTITDQPCTWINDLKNDDDENGYIDDIRGWNFYKDNNDPLDDNGHGTHVAGIIGAISNNGKGVVGIAPRVTLMPLKFLGLAGQGTNSDAIEALAYARSKRVVATNNSWGGGGYSDALKEEIRRGGDNQILFVTAAGNSASNNDALPNYPSSFGLPSMVTVAATDMHDQLAYFSNYGGATVDVAAPGMSILSTYLGNTYERLSGTSMATPQVTGSYLLLRSAFPTTDMLVLKQMLLRGGQELPSLRGIVRSEARLNIGQSFALKYNTVYARSFTVDDSATSEIVGNRDAVVSPGETAAIHLSLMNETNTPLQGVKVRLSLATQDGSIDLPREQLNLAQLPVGESTTPRNAPLLIKVQSDAIPHAIDLLVRIQIPGQADQVTPLTVRVINAQQFTGVVRLDGKVYGGAEVVYAGPVSAVQTTLPDGSFTLGGTPGLYGISVKLGSYVFSDPLNSSLPSATPLVFDLVTAVKGRIIDAATNKPVPFAVVDRVDYNGQLKSSYRVDALGNFIIASERESAQGFYLRVRSPGRYLSQTIDIPALDFGTQREIKLAPGNLTLKTQVVADDGIVPQILGTSVKGRVAGYLQDTNLKNGVSTVSEVAFITQADGSVKTIQAEIESALGRAAKPTYMSHAHAVNDRGQAVGSILWNQQFDGFFYDNGSARLIDPLPGYERVWLTSINNSAEIAGISIKNIVYAKGKTGIQVQPTVWFPRGDGTYLSQNLGSLGGDPVVYADFPVMINDDGIVTGTSINSAGYYRAFLWNKGVMYELPAPPGTGYATGDVISPLGRVAGSANDGKLRVAGFVWEKGMSKQLTSSRTYSIIQPTAIEDITGDVLGLSYDNYYRAAAFLWHKGELMPLQDLFEGNRTPGSFNANDPLVFATRPFVDEQGRVILSYYDALSGKSVIAATTPLSSLPVVTPPVETPAPVTPPPVTPPEAPLPVPSQAQPPPPVPVTPPAAPPAIAPIVDFVKGDFDGDRLSDLQVSKKIKKGKSEIYLNQVYLSSSKKVASVEFGVPGAIAAHGRYLPSSNWQLAYVTTNRKQGLLWSLRELQGGAAKKISFGKKGDRIITGCDLIGGDTLSDMAVLRGKNKIIVRNSATGKSSTHLLTLPAKSRIIDADCRGSGQGVAEKLVVLTKRSTKGAGEIKEISVFTTDFTPLRTAQVPVQSKRILIADLNFDNTLDIATRWSEKAQYILKDETGSTGYVLPKRGTLASLVSLSNGIPRYTLLMMGADGIFQVLGVQGLHSESSFPPFQTRAHLAAVSASAVVQ